MLNKIVAITLLLIASVQCVLEVDVDTTFKPKGFGQPSGIAVDTYYRVYIFHRGERIWDAKTFDDNNVFRDKNAGPIDINTILITDQNGNKLGSTGKNLFYLPHGITVDDANNLWITDVALHQVFKFAPLPANLTNLPTSLEKAVLKLGEALQPGSDTMHFCKPTSVAVCLKTGDFYVADGYCNSRIIKYDSQGNFLLQWGRPTWSEQFRPFSVGLSKYSLNIPHSLTVDTKRDHLIVADRENFRITFFEMKSGRFVNVISANSAIYGVAYCNVSDELFAVLNPNAYTKGSGLIYSISNGSLTGVFNPPNHFQSPHEVAVSPDCSSIYAVELHPFATWKFTREVVSKNNEAGLKNNEAVKSSIISESTPLNGATEKMVVTSDLVEDLSYTFLTGNEVAITIVCAVILISILAIGCHILRKAGDYKKYEMKELILDDED